MKSIAAASLVVGASAGGTLAITYSDCGTSSTHGKITSLTPTELTLGTTATLSGSGTIDMDVTGGDFVIKVTAGGGLVKETYNGQICSPLEIDLPLNLGKVMWKGLSCPAAAGSISVELEATMAAIIPASLAKADIALSGTGPNGEDLLCVNVHLEKEAELTTRTEPTFAEWAAQNGINGDDATMEAKYETNVAEISSLREQHPDATFGVNQFSGMSFEEFAAMYLNAEKSDASFPLMEEKVGETVQNIDWVAQGGVTPVKDQASCGSCWAFSTTAVIEAVHKINTGNTVSLSEQQLVDCSTQNNGCSGGRPDWAVTYLQSHAPYTSSSYPYRGSDGSCKSGSSAGVSVSGYTHVGTSESALASALSSSPVSVMIYADSAFQSYRSGILSGSTVCNLNHAVLAVGYGSNYWKIKNSWGSSWGESGYVRFTKGLGGCGAYGIVYDNPVVPTGVNADVIV